MNTKITFQSLLESFFLKWMMQQKNSSGKTISSYRDSFRIYLQFLNERMNIKPNEVMMEHFDVDFIMKFTVYLTEKRKNKPITINNRLAAIKSFLKFASYEAPEYIGLIRRSLTIPMQKHETKVMTFITKEEFDSILKTCERKSLIAQRDRVMFLLLFNTGIRVSELLNIKAADIYDLDKSGQAYIKIFGKGRKERVVPIWKKTADELKSFLKTTKKDVHDKLFMGKNGEELTRSGIRFRINKAVSEAQKMQTSLKDKNISVHTFRHSTAMNLLQSGVDITTIAIWLGHESIETTHKYMVANLELKREAMNKISMPDFKVSYNYKPSKDLLEFLETL